MENYLLVRVIQGNRGDVVGLAGGKYGGHMGICLPSRRHQSPKRLPQIEEEWLVEIVDRTSSRIPIIRWICPRDQILGTGVWRHSHTGSVLDWNPGFGLPIEWHSAATFLKGWAKGKVREVIEAFGRPKEVSYHGGKLTLYWGEVALPSWMTLGVAGGVAALSIIPEKWEFVGEPSAQLVPVESFYRNIKLDTEYQDPQFLKGFDGGPASARVTFNRVRQVTLHRQVRIEGVETTLECVPIPVLSWIDGEAPIYEIPPCGKPVEEWGNQKHKAIMLVVLQTPVTELKAMGDFPSEIIRLAVESLPKEVTQTDLDKLFGGNARRR